MRVALVGTLPEADRDALRGPERTTIGLANHLADRGHTVCVVADEGAATTVDARAEVIGGELTPGVDRLVRFYRRCRPVLREFDPDVVHTWRPAPSPDVCSLHSVAATATIEARRPGTFPWRWRAGARIERFAKRLTARRADRVAVTAPQNLADATAHGIHPDRIIPVGVDRSFLQSGRSSGRRLRVLTVGRLEPKKNQAFVARQVPDDCELRLVGPASDPDYAASIPALADRWDGAVPHEDLLAEYRRADVCVLPSVFEGFGLTAVEAMAAETPVVVADTCGIAAHVYDRPIGAVYRGDDPDSFRRALSAVRANREAYGRAARTYVERRLTWPTIAEQYEREYRRVVGERAAATPTAAPLADPTP